MAQLEVGIGADPSGLQKGIKTAVSAIDVLKKRNEELQISLKKNVTNSVQVSASIEKIQKQFKDGAISSKSFQSQLSQLSTTEFKLSNENKSLSASLSQVNKQTNQLGGSSGMGKLTKGAANGSSAMTAFSRTIQDAPFGIMGVSNNITNLTEQFGYLKARTGSAGGALKAMLKDLTGFGGITLAISVVTSLLLVFGDKLFKTKDKAKALKEEQEKLTNSLNDYVDGLEAVQQAGLKGAKSAQKEAISLRLLRTQAEDTNLSMKDRIGAVNELQKMYPSYLGNVSKEKILNGEVAKTFDILTISILKRAKATAALNQIVQNSEKLLILESQQAAEKQKLIDLEKKHIAAIAENKTSAGSYYKMLVNDARDAVNEQKKILNSLSGDIQNIELSNIDLEKAVSDFGGVVPLDFSLNLGKNKKAISLLDLAEVVPADMSVYADIILSDLRKLADNFDIALEGKGIDWEAAYNAIKQLEKQAEVEANLMAFNESMNNIITNSLIGTLGQIGTAFGEALATGGNVLSSIGQTLIQGLAGFLGKMGDLLIEYGTLAVIKGKLDVAIALGGPIAIAAGFAAIAIGVALKAVSGAMGSLASGGSSGVASSGGSGSGNSQMTSNNGFSGGNSNNSGGTVIFEIAGTKLIGVLSNTLSRNKNLGGTLSIST